MRLVKLIEFRTECPNDKLAIGHLAWFPFERIGREVIKLTRIVAKRAAIKSKKAANGVVCNKAKAI